MIEIQKYSLPDHQLIDLEATFNDWLFWIPDEDYLALGQSNKLENSLIVDKVLEDKIKVIKRPSGGESVLLSPNTLVISLRLLTDKLENPQVSFKKINNAIIAALGDLGVKNLKYRGISDICIGEKKILGSSIYRKKHIVFYHAVLNISEEISRISKYLKHPPREPDYRKGRPHSDFVTSLVEQGYDLGKENIINSLKLHFNNSLT